MKPQPRMVKFFEGWAAMTDTWMVCAFTHDEAWRRFVAADLHGQPYPKRLPEWVSWLCWFGAIEVAILRIIDGGGRLNAGLFFALAVLGFIATFVRTEIAVWVGYAAELAFIGQMYWTHPGDRFLGPLLLFAVVGWLALWVDRWFHVRRNIRLWFAQHPLRRDARDLVARR
jgi:hypothetical protein